MLKVTIENINEFTGKPSKVIAKMVIEYVKRDEDTGGHEYFVVADEIEDRVHNPIIEAPDHPVVGRFINCDDNSVWNIIEESFKCYEYIYPDSKLTKREKDLIKLGSFTDKEKFNY